MNENNDNNEILFEKFEQLNNMEQNISKIYLLLYLKSISMIKNHKIQLFKSNFENQLEFYGQSMQKYKSSYQENLKKYEELLGKIINGYNELYINEQLELQEAESNKKIVILNILKIYDLKQPVLSEENYDSSIVSDYEKQIQELLNKKEKYDCKIADCELALKECIDKLIEQVNRVFKDYSYDLVPVKGKKIKEFFNKIANIFSGATKFNTFVMEPIIVENEKIEKIMPEIINNLDQEKKEFLQELNELEDALEISA